MKAWLKWLLIGQILFIIYAVIGTLLPSSPVDYEDIIFVFILITFNTIIIGLIIDSIKLKWPSWINGGLIGLISSNIFLLGVFTYYYFALNIFNCNTDGWMVSCPLSINIIITFLNWVIFFTIGALIGLIFGKRKSKKQVQKKPSNN